ncbi:MAG TPA: nucleotidyltransferase family protein [Gemmatimonadaceae bacterium]
MALITRVAGVVLAAGGSTRFGSPKQLIVDEGEMLVRRAARVAYEAGADPVIVVLGSDADLIAPQLDGMPAVTTIVNHEWRTGLASSLVAGLRAASALGDCEAVLVTLADQPSIDASEIKRLIDAFDDRHRIIASSYDNVIGVPAVFGVEYVDELSRLEGDAGAGSWLRRRESEVTQIALVSGHLDVDTPEDLAELQSRRQTSP